MHPLHTPSGISPNTGPLATAAWLLARDVFPKQRDWFVEIELALGETKFQIEIYSGEWGFAFHHDERVSWIRVTDISFVHGRDDFELLREVAGLRDLGLLLRDLEARFDLAFPRDAATIHTNIDDAEPAIRAWIATL